MQVFRSWVVCVTLAAAGPTFAEGISGTYVGKGTNGAYLVQIVQTSDGHLTGRYAQVLLQAGGRLQEVNASISGASDGAYRCNHN